MKQDKYNPGIYWHGGKMFFTGGAMMDFMKSNKSEFAPIGQSQQQYADPLMNIATNRQTSPYDSFQDKQVSSPLMNMAAGKNIPPAEGAAPATEGAEGASPAGPSLASYAAPIAALGTGAVNIIGKPGGKGTAAATGALSGAAAGAALGPIGMGVGALIGGVGSFLGAKKQQHQEQIQENALDRQRYMAGTGGINNSIYAAYGGMIPKLTEFNEGGTHEQNPNQGIQQGMGEDGKPNLVEEGETKFKNYVFSDRLTLPNAKEYLLGGSLEGKTFADISKKLSKSIEQRPNDPIAQLGQDRVLNRLKTANDDAIAMQEFSDQNQQMKCGGKMKGMRKFEYGGYIFKDI